MGLVKGGQEGGRTPGSWGRDWESENHADENRRAKWAYYGLRSATP